MFLPRLREAEWVAGMGGDREQHGTCKFFDHGKQCPARGVWWSRLETVHGQICAPSV